MSRILMADDDLVQLDLRKQVLESAGHEVELAFTPHQALRQLERGWANLLIMDLRFLNAAGNPDSEEGLTLIRSIHEKGCRAPVVVLSGWPDDLYGHPEEAMVARVMMKPVPSRELLEMVAELVTA
jgi:CheY-like chemotaxis protein